MRAELGPIALTAGYCFAGFGVLAALRFVRPTLAGVAAALGLAFFVGVAVVPLAGIALLCVGAPVDISVLSIVAVLVGSGGVAVAWRRAGYRRPAPSSWGRMRPRPSTRSAKDALQSMRRLTPERWLAIVVIGALALFAALTYRWAQVQPLDVWDSWSIWARKGTLLADYSHLPTAFFTSPVYAFMHPDYPLLLPLYESTWFRVLGSADTQSLHAWFWILFVAFLWATAYVASRVARPVVWAPLIGLLAVIPALRTQLMTMYADVPMGLFLMVGALLLGLWIVDRRRRDLALSVILLAAAANTKNEGLTGATIALVVALLVTAVAPAPGLTRRRALTPLLFALAAYAVAVAPWRLWLAAHHITGEMPVGQGLQPSYLLAHSDRIQPTVNALFSEVTNQGNWYYLLPIGLALMIAGLATPGLRRIAAFYALAMLGAAVLVLWAYVINPNELSWLISTSANRTVVGPMLIAAAGTFHLAGALLTHSVQRAKSSAARDQPVPATATHDLQSVSSG
jgi:hypothetical protein